MEIQHVWDFQRSRRCVVIGHVGCWKSFNSASIEVVFSPCFPFFQGPCRFQVLNLQVFCDYCLRSVLVKPVGGRSTKATDFFHFRSSFPPGLVSLYRDVWWWTTRPCAHREASSYGWWHPLCRYIAGDLRVMLGWDKNGAPVDGQMIRGFFLLPKRTNRKVFWIGNFHYSKFLQLDDFFWVVKRHVRPICAGRRLFFDSISVVSFLLQSAQLKEINVNPNPPQKKRSESWLRIHDVVYLQLAAFKQKAPQR